MSVSVSVLVSCVYVCVRAFVACTWTDLFYVSPFPCDFFLLLTIRVTSFMYSYDVHLRVRGTYCQQVGEWEVSPLMPISIPAARAKNQSLPPIDQLAGINPAGFYSNIWKGQDLSVINQFMANMTEWNWGVTDPDVCCNDGKAPSYMLHTLSQQGGTLPPGTKTFNMAAMGLVNASLFEWFRGYFPSSSSP